MLLMIDPDDEVVREIEVYPIGHYLTGYELSYLVFGLDHRGKGYATEAVKLLTAYLFARLRINRAQLASTRRTTSLGGWPRKPATCSKV